MKKKKDPVSWFKQVLINQALLILYKNNGVWVDELYER